MNQKTQSIIHLGTTICLIHCIITPLLIIYAPFFGHFFHNIWVEIGLLSLSLLFGMFIIYNGYCQHKQIHSSLLFVIGVLFWGLHTLSEHYAILNISPLILLIIGSGLLFGSYYINHRTLNCCDNYSCKN